MLNAELPSAAQMGIRSESWGCETVGTVRHSIDDRKKYGWILTKLVCTFGDLAWTDDKLPREKSSS